MDIVTVEGKHEKMGYDLGCRLGKAIRHNVALREGNARIKGMEEGQIGRLARRYSELSSAPSLKMMEGLSRGSGVPLGSLLRFNALQDVLYPEGCTSLAALGRASAGGSTVFLKNRDASPRDFFVGPNYYRNRELNVVQVLKTPDGNTILGVTIAGLAGLMMGVNQYGVATASNFGQTEDYTADPSTIDPEYGVNGRTQLMREGLEMKTVQDAVKHTLGKLTESSMSTPGILWFMDAKNIFVIEGSYREFAVEHVEEGVVARGNQFLLLDKLDDAKAISSFCRYTRARHLLDSHFGAIDREKMKEFSMDHKNGPGPNSICKHGKGEEIGATESASIIELKEKPEESRISIALGSPCWAWRNRDGHLTIQMDESIRKIPPGFFDGAAFRENFKEEAYKQD